jgi:hypothetical protein
MKRKILLITLGLVVVAQLPFAYRRYRLSRLHNSIEQLASQRTVAPTENDYIDYRGVIHVHSSLGGHSTGNFAELISAAKINQLDFVIITEHPQADFDTSAMTLNGTHAGVLFLNGNEVTTADGDRLLLIPGSIDAAAMSGKTSREVVDKQHADGGLSIAAYPTESQAWASTSIDGIEVYNLFTNARDANRVALFFDGLWSYGRYPDLMFANFFARPAESLKRWDDAISNGNHRLVATAGNDAHSNIGLSVNDASGKQWLGVKLDPYERSFHVVRTHVLLKKDSGLTRESLLEAIANGHCYVSFDLFGDAKGFIFQVTSPERRIMGDEIGFVDGLRVMVSAPLISRIVLYRDGTAIDEKSGSKVEFPINSKGAYRVEAYLDSLPAPGTGKPWILSNPIYIK